MAQTVVGLFDDRDHAQAAVKDFLNEKFPTDRISIITTDARGEFVQQPVTSDPGSKVGEGAATGLLSGAIVGGVFGLLVGVGVLLIPGIGVLAAGPVATALAGAGIGALGGGLLGALIGLGIPKDQAATYAEAIRRGGCLVAAEVNDAQLARANEIMKKRGAVDIHQRSAYYQSQGFTAYDPKAPAYTQQQILEERARLRDYHENYVAGTTPPVLAEDVVRTRYQSIGDVRNMPYEQWEPAYRFGWRLGHDAQYQSFNHGEATIRQMWEQSNPGSFMMYRDAIYSGFNDAFAQRSGPKMM